MKPDWKAFIFGVLVTLTVVSVGLTFFVANILPEMVEKGVTDALSVYEIEIQ